MKKILAIFTFLFMVMTCSIPFLKDEPKDSVDVHAMIQNTTTEEKQVLVNVILQDLVETAIEEMQIEMLEIENITNKKEWYIAYKQIISQYDDILEPPETIYDYFTDEEVYLIQRTVETECYDQNFDAKCNVASVILNRIEAGDEFGESVENVITKQNQFVYTRKNITYDTVLAVEYAFEINDTTSGCIAFRSDKKVNDWYDGWEYVFTDDANHHFYKNKKKEDNYNE